MEISMNSTHRNIDSNIFQDEFTCFICKNYFIDPVTIGCGHSFCMPCLCIFWEEAPRPPHCPMCWTTSPQVNFKTNIVLRTRTFLARRARPHDLPGSTEEICLVHMRTKGFFCEVIKDLLCVLCSKSKEHAAHRHCSIDWIAEEYRKKLLEQMRSVWEKTQENQRNLNRETSKIKTWEDNVTLRKRMIRAEYRKVHLLLYTEERHYLERIEMESKEIFQQLRESKDSMYLKGTYLREVYEELKEMCHKPDMEMLQHFENLLKKSELVQLKMPQPVDPQLSSWPITGLVNRLNQFLVHISLDYERVTCHIPLFKDLRRSLLSPNHPDADNAPIRYFLAWGDKTFASGQHYWEVDVAGCCNWVIGFCDDSWTGRDDMILGAEGMFLLFCVQEGDQCRLCTYSPPLPQYVERPLSHVGVFLDYEHGILSFINVANSSLISSFLSCSFSSPLRPFLYSGYP